MGTRFRSIAATVSYSLQALVEASLGHVIKACDDFHREGRFGEDPSASSMCFELPNPSAAPIVTYLLNYVGPSCDFKASMRIHLQICLELFASGPRQPLVSTGSQIGIQTS